MSDPESIDDVMHRARKALQDGRNEEALVELQRAIQLAPNMAEAHGRRGEALRRLARYQDALAVVATHLRAPIDTFFDTVFVMSEDAALRQNRLSLLAEIAGTVSRVAHFHALST